MLPFRKSVRKILTTIAILIVLFLLASTSTTFFFFYTNKGLKTLETAIENNLEKNGKKIDIEFDAPQNPSHLRLNRIRFMNEEKTLIDLQDIEIDWSPWKLAFGNFYIDQISVKKAVIHPFPKKQEKSDFEMPSISPILAKIERFHIHEIDAKDFYPNALSLEGSADFGLIAKKTQTTFVLKDKTHKDNFCKGSGQYSFFTDHARIKLILHDKQGYITKKLGQGEKPFTLFVKGDGTSKKFPFITHFKSGETDLKTDIQAKYDDDEVELEGTFDLGLKKQTFKGELEAKIDLKDFEAEIEKIEAKSALQSFEAKGKANFQEVKMKGKATIELKNMGLELPPLETHFKIKGAPLKPEIKFQSKLDDPQAKANLIAHVNPEGEIKFKGKIKRLTLEKPALDLQNFDLNGHGKIDFKKLTLTLHQLKASNGISEGTFSGEINPQKWQGNLLLNLAAETQTLDALNQSYDEFHGKITLSGNFQDAAIFTKAQFDLHNMKGQFINADRMHLETTTTLSQDFTFTKPLQLKGSLEKDTHTLPLNAQITLQDKTYKFSNIILGKQTDGLWGNITLLKDLTPVKGYFDFHFQSLTPLTMIMPIHTLEGSLHGTLNIANRNLQTKLKLFNMVYINDDQDWRLKNGLIICNIDDLWDQRETQFKGTFFDAFYQDYFAKNIHIESNGPFSNLDVSFKTKVIEPVAFENESRFNLSILDQAFKAQFQKLTGHINQEKYTINKPFTFALHNNLWQIENLALRTDSGHLDAHLKASPKSITGTLSSQKFPLEGLKVAYPDFKYEGDISCHFDLGGTFKNPQFKGEVNIEYLDRFIDPFERNDETTKAQDVHLRIQTKYDKGHLTLESKLENTETQPLSINADLPLTLSVKPLKTEFSLFKPFKAQIKGPFELALLKQILPGFNDHFEGFSETDIDASGTLLTPNLKGKIHVKNGLYENALSGLNLENITFKLDANGYDVNLSELRATSGKKGTLHGSGKILLFPDIETKLKIGFNKMQTVFTDEADIKTSGNITFRGNLLKGMRLDGDIKIQEANIQIPDTGGGGNEHVNEEVLKLIHEQNFMSEEEIEEPEAPKKPSAFLKKIALNLSIHNKKPIYVNGFGIKSEWKSDLTIKGNAAEPLGYGKIALKSGDFDLLGPRFIFKKGSLSFDENKLLHPMIDLRAETKNDDITAFLNINGPLKAPEIKLTSNPQRNMEEILSELVFKKGASQISPYQAFKIANVLNHISKKKTGAPTIDLLHSFERVLGLESIDVIDGEDLSDTRLAVTKRLHKNVRIGFAQDIKNQETYGKLEAEVTPNISVETGLSTNNDASIGVKTQWDY